MRNAETPAAHVPIFSRTAGHAVRAVLYLCRNRASGLVPAKEVAAALGAPANYLSKILRRLAQKGLLRSVRGPHGGFELLVAPESLTTSEIVEAVDEVVEHAHCLLGDRLCDPDDPCDAHLRWTTLLERVRRPLEDTSMADLLGDDYMVTPDIDS